MNNLSSYCGLVDAKIRNSDKDLPVWKEAFFQFFLQKGKSRQFSALRNRLWSEVKQTSHGDNIFFQYIKPPHSIVKWSNFTIPFHYQCFRNLKSIQQTHQNCWKLKSIIMYLGFHVGYQFPLLSCFWIEWPVWHMAINLACVNILGSFGYYGRSPIFQWLFQGIKVFP